MEGIAYLGAGIAMLGVLWAGLGLGIATKGIVEAISRNPEKEKTYMILGILGMGLIEATAIYAFVVAILIIFQAK